MSKVTPVKERSNFLTMEVGSGRIKPKVIAIMCSQFATIISAGMSMSRCVELVADQTSDKGLKAILTEVADDVSAGHSLATSFENKGGKKLPVLFYETIRAGEQAGTLDQSFQTLHKYYDKTSKTKAKVAQALTYPVFVIVLAIVVVAVVMVAVIPTFKDILSSYDSEMPVITQVLIDASDFVAANILWIVLVLAAVIIGVKLWTKTERGRVAWSTFKLRLPVLGNIIKYSNAAQFANTMSTLLGSGLHMTHAVDVTAKVLDSYVISENVAKMTTKLEEGKRLSLIHISVTTGQLVALEKSQQAYYSVTSAAELLRDAIEGGTCTAVGTGEGATWTCALVERADNVTGVEGLNAWLEALVAKVPQDDPQATVTSSFDVAFAGASPAVNESVLAVRADVTMRADYSLHVSLRPKDYDEAVGDYRVTLEIPAALLHRDDETTVERIVWERAIIGKPSLLGGAA